MVLGLAKVERRTIATSSARETAPIINRSGLQPKRNIARLSPRTRRMRRLSIIWVAP